MLILVGSHESLLDDSVRVAAAAEAVGVEVELEVWEEMFHIWPYFAAMLPEGQRAIERMGSFIDQVMRRQTGLRDQEPM